MKVLIVDDEPDVRSLVLSALQYARVPLEGIEAGDADEALALARSARPDLMVLDLALPKRDGFSVLEELRRTSDLPVIVLTARGLEHDKIRGLELGADDYMTKPFSPRELLARIETVLRRTTRGASETRRGVIEVGDLRVDIGGRRVFLGNEEVRLTRTEFDLLAELAVRRGEALPHEFLLEKVWGPEYKGENHYLKVYIGRLRDKLEDDAAQPRLIVNVRGIGYRLNVP
ncbi:MAG TPA: response regulator transcription factor [Candidatus Limnocylindria bacterium]|nr:response regulator transcription factor [Candidatus Limnocylindria bacterium]